MTRISDLHARASATALELNPAARSRLAAWMWAALVALLAAALCAPFMRSVFWLGDEGVLLAGAERMLHGSQLYNDFFEFLPPGGFLITAAWLDAAGISMSSARILAILTIAGIACFTFLACRQTCKSAFYPVLVVIAWLAMTQGYWTEISHHWFTTLFAMIAAWAALSHANHGNRSLSAPILAGLAAGTAAMVVPTRGALAMIAGAAAFAGVVGARRELLLYVAASLVVPAGLLGYVVATHALGAAFDDVIIFPASQYASFAATPYGYFASLQNYPLLFYFPIVALLMIFTYVRGWPASIHDRTLRSAVSFGVAGFIGCFPRPDLAHIGFAVPLAGPLFVYCIKCVTASSLRRYRAVIAALGVMLCLPSGLAYWLIAQQVSRAETVSTARGTVALLDDVRAAKELVALIGSPAETDRYFFYPLMPLLSFLSGNEQVSKYDVFTPGYTLPAQYREACIAVTQHATWVVVDRNWTDGDFLRKVFPGLQNPGREEAKRFEAALAAGFGLVGQYGPFELRHRDSGIEQIDCARITG
jgi:hypothetical protein